VKKAVQDWASQDQENQGMLAPEFEGLVVLDLKEKIFYTFKSEDRCEQPGNDVIFFR